LVQAQLFLFFWLFEAQTFLLLMFFTSNRKLQISSVDANRNNF